VIPLPSLTDSAASLGLAVLAIALVVFGTWIGRWTAPEANPVTETDTVRVEAPLTPSEIMDATTPTQVTEYDTSETRTQCIEVPTWLANSAHTQSESERWPNGTLPDSTRRSESQYRRQKRSLTRLQNTASPTYAITPMTTGRPSLSVGTEQVTLSGYLPDGRGRQWTYDIPRPTWSIAPSVTAEATPDGPVTSAALTVSRKSLAVSAGYEVAQDYHGWTVGLTWTPYEATW